MPLLLREGYCQCAKTPAQQSSKARKAKWCSPVAAMKSPSLRGCKTPTRPPTCAIARWHRSTCTKKRTPERTFRLKSRSAQPMATPTNFFSWRKVEEAQTRVTCFKKPKRCSTRQPCCHGSTKKCSLLARPHALPITSQLRSGERQPNSQSRPQSWPQQSTSTGYQPRGQPSDTDFATPTLKKKCSNSAATPESAPSLAVSTFATTSAS